MKHVYFRRASSINRNGWFLTGGVTFYKSDTRLDHVKIFNALGEDALNIIQSPFKLENSLIQEAVSDGFDGDFAEGTITHCVFRKIGGDGIDFSGSKVHVTFSDFEDIRDKAVSAGEGSRLDLKNIKIVRSSTGVASKDASHVEIKDSRFKEIFSAALTTYVKKTEYKAPGSINSMGSPMELVERQGYAQTGSTLIIDGSPVPTEEMDVEKLYNTGIMRK